MARSSFLVTLKQQFDYPDDHVFALESEERNDSIDARQRSPGVEWAAQPAGERRPPAQILIGHGTTGEGDEAKFNLPGPDLKSAEWADLLKSMPARIVFVNTTGGSFPFMRRMAGAAAS
jgi:hypothetical protein